MANWVQRQISSVNKGIKDAVDKCSTKIHDWIDRYEDVLREGNYQNDNRTVLDRLFMSRRRNSLDSARAVVSSLSRNATKEIFKRIIVTTAIVALAQYAFVAGIAFGVATMLLSTYEYRRAAKARLDVIEELNVAGQHVKGTRADLCRLRVAQERITNVNEGFRPGMMKRMTDAMNDIVRSVGEERARVTVLDTGEYDTDVELYDFSEKKMKLMNYAPDMPQRKCKSDKERPTVDLASLDLAKAWDGKRVQPMSNDEIVDRLAELQMGLSEGMQKAVSDKIAAAKAGAGNAVPPVTH